MVLLKQKQVRALALTFVFLTCSIASGIFIVRTLVDTMEDSLPPGLVAFMFPDRDRDPFRADAVTDPAYNALTYGVQAFLWWDTGFGGVHMDWVDLMSFTHIKQTFAWQDIEPNQDEWHFENGDRILDEADRRGLHVIARLSDSPDWSHPSLPSSDETDLFIDAPPDNLDDWANYCGRVAERYAGRMAGYQIWNEPNLTREWGGEPPDASGYVDLLQVCSEAIRAVDPEAIIISAGLSPTGDNNVRARRDDIFLQEMYDAGFADYVDVVGVHAPGYAPPSYGPDDAEADGRGRWATFRRVEDLRKIMIRNDDEATQIAILEIGYTTDPRPESLNAWFAVDEATQAQYLVEAYTYAAENWRPWVGLMSAIYIPRPSWTPDNEQYWWAITDPEMVEIRPAFAALAQMPKYCGDIIIPLRSPEESAIALESNPCD